MSIRYTASIRSREPVSDDQTKWVGLQAIKWIDPAGKERTWEAADRKTRKGEVDAVAICTIIERPSSEPHILLVSQYRPPVDGWVVEMPAGLVDQGEEGKEGSTRAALRELQEETGYGGPSSGDGSDGRGELNVLETSDIMANDPGMSGANMRLCVVKIEVADDAPEPVAQPEEGEFIEKHLVPLKGLYLTLQEMQRKGYSVDARLAHFAVGLSIADAAAQGGKGAFITAFSSTGATPRS
ncbi:hypothetical protein K437DRAFT_219312 [Tilletiaria anomala UBC 951]|uniref:Nudix hydrolase domain-containing protein n=1 Tax=Tilletiaria anomala (strain ATCC 24038 / CBS 436.72 / UBC 951) TaxID=1037660 RepID=A0A066WQJ8_TILAU|nr:uncharacterized protein K437DRAFT_219312 [Tilletiaria anomala UBC 951]KDN53289.1 hypothetical protein K437DRAFT_219312 [Tilletiaria anomala UBC 951]